MIARSLFRLLMVYGEVFAWAATRPSSLPDGNEWVLRRVLLLFSLVIDPNAE